MPLTMQDITLKVGERGIILGKTRTGKSTLAEHLIETWREEYKDSFTLIADTKPRFRGERELNGIPTSISRRYSRDDWGEVVPDSVVLPLLNVRSELKQARSLGYKCAIAQIRERNRDTIMLVSNAIRYAYEDRPPKKPLFVYVDELNNFFRDAPQAARWPIVTVITSGGERSVSFLGAAQRPRNISIESMESLNKLYWFYTPYKEDVKHLKEMGIPETARPAPAYYQFYFFNGLNNQSGLAQLSLRK